jgi:hypothetical protein
LGRFNVFFGLRELIIAAEEVYQLGEDGVLVGLVFEHFLELFYGFGVLVFFEQNLSQ